MISYETMNLLIKYFQDYPELKGIPASSEEIKHAENILGIKFHDDYIEFIKNSAAQALVWISMLSIIQH